MPYAVVDLFAGPGGLGEGFSSFLDGSAFKIVLSAELDEYAHRTLLLRSFCRSAKQLGDDKGLDEYYLWCNGKSNLDPLDEKFEASEAAENETLRVTLGTPDGNTKVAASLKSVLTKDIRLVKLIRTEDIA
jgi:DNA (cytosine-5)-methyltransferase 1